MQPETTSNVTIQIELCAQNASLPFYANDQDAGMDIAAAAEVILPPGETGLIPTGIKVAIPPGYEIQIRPRSGLSLNTPLRLANAPGTIDSGYRDEIKIILTNTSCADHADCSTGTPQPNAFLTASDKGNQQGTYRISPGDRIAQLVLQKVPRIQWEKVPHVEDIGMNRGGGFGSSGVKVQ